MTRDPNQTQSLGPNPASCEGQLDRGVISSCETMRQLKYHEQKLLKKVNLYDWKSERNVREIKILRRYHIQRREDYVKYDKIVGMVKKMVSMVKMLDPQDPKRMQLTDELLEKLYDRYYSVLII